ncbi:unnamed protein product [Paramecium pentaurelia]|uniref:Uncharacterized protein n=1 Tax=Paramecium pentaurelia TaxID=43138 RepID=A0A8S1TV73_9CILI|nr:unnamed protein product [Paramecium pentaurelia]
MNINYLYQQIEDQDEQIEKATKVIETLTAEIETQQKEIIRLKYENEYLNSQNKILEKEKLALQKESNNIDTIKKCEIRQKQINVNQKEKIEKYQTLWSQQELNYNNTIIELNENIKQLQLQNEEKQNDLELLFKQSQQQQLAINQVMEILEQKEQELQQLNQYLNNQKENTDNFSTLYKQDIENLKKFTENLFIQSDKNIIMQINKNKTSKNNTLSKDINQTHQIAQQYKEEQKDESHIYDIILRQSKYINEIYTKLQNTISNEQLSEFIVQVNYMRQYFEIMQNKIQDINVERNIIHQAYMNLVQQNKTQQSYIEQLLMMIKNYQNNNNNEVEMINNINQLDINILDPINENMQKLLSTYQSSLITKDEEKMSLERQNVKLQQKLDQLQSQQQQLMQTSQQSQQLVSLLQNPKKQVKNNNNNVNNKMESLEKENQQLIEQLNELSKEHEETVKMLDKAITQLEQQTETIQKFEQEQNNKLKSKNSFIETQQPTTQLIESQIDKFLESCSLLPPLKSQSDSVVQKTNILIDLVTMLTDSQHDILQKLLVTFLVTRDNKSLQGFEKDFSTLKSIRHNIGILDYLDQLECLKNDLLNIIEKELKCEYAIPYGKSILIQVLNLIAQKYMEIVQKDTQSIEKQMKKYKNHIVIYKMYKQWKECILDFSEIIFEIIESIDHIGQPQFESKLNQQIEKLNYNFIDNFDD